ncbi:hypothetical protein MCOR27_011813 [Pyricularia oryzae]|nr:hypothetical protein MCOR01_011791 [Pyricularia oryzae]KAH9439969.1 hypothetical protein MCOR02_012527 [Pyricularia oryzae]KAI6268308.1 hypothetical protein MCOR26_009268 [Pyricularia oryzae]KAI6283382.1 hypothetical protein MCOR27_011813 [Pyricularia oryzae]KAI6321173.1 hypothetical protein MCOR34_002741 [Pyricularia oryzae]
MFFLPSSHLTRYRRPVFCSSYSHRLPLTQQGAERITAYSSTAAFSVDYVRLAPTAFKSFQRKKNKAPLSQCWVSTASLQNNPVLGKKYLFVPFSEEAFAIRRSIT